MRHGYYHKLSRLNDPMAKLFRGLVQKIQRLYLAILTLHLFTLAILALIFFYVSLDYSLPITTRKLLPHTFKVESAPGFKFLFPRVPRSLEFFNDKTGSSLLVSPYQLDMSQTRSGVMMVSLPPGSRSIDPAGYTHLRVCHITLSDLRLMDTLFNGLQTWRKIDTMRHNSR
jgi:hypothetical protein